VFWAEPKFRRFFGKEKSGPKIKKNATLDAKSKVQEKVGGGGGAR
jgi:hypothetical protein